MSRTNRLLGYTTRRTRLTCQVLESRETPAAFVVNDAGNGGDDDLDDPAALDANARPPSERQSSKAMTMVVRTRSPSAEPSSRHPGTTP
jgi:hypothetical protein